MKISDKIRSLRKRRGYTLQKLADQTQLSKGYLSRIERSHQAPPVYTLQKIAHALRVDIDEFFDGEGVKSGIEENIDIVRKEERQQEEEFNDFSTYIYAPLIKSFKHKYMFPVVVTITKGITEFFSHDSEEFVYVLKGPITLLYDNGEYHFDTGDSFYFDSRIKHAWENNSEEPAKVLGVNFDYRRF